MKEQTKEGNRKIAEFMQRPYKFQRAKFVDKSLYEEEILPRYEDDWNELMPVVEKCRKICREMQLKYPAYKDLDDVTGWRSWSYRYVKLETDIGYVFRRVLDFIEWYNKEQEAQASVATAAQSSDKS